MQRFRTAACAMVVQTGGYDGGQTDTETAREMRDGDLIIILERSVGYDDDATGHLKETWTIGEH